MAPSERDPEAAFQGESPETSHITLIIPSLGAPTLDSCLQAVADLDPAPDRTIVVLSGSAGLPPEVAEVGAVDQEFDVVE